MKACDTHWAALRTALDVRGLTKFIAKNGEDAAQRVKASEFEPLVGSYMICIQNAVVVGGAQLLAQQPEVCPFCYLVSQCTCGKASCSANLVDTLADAAFGEAARLNLIDKN